MNGDFLLIASTGLKILTVGFEEYIQFKNLTKTYKIDTREKKKSSVNR